MNNINTWAVVVTYYPNIELFERVINSISNQLSKILIVDNSDKSVNFERVIKKFNNVEIVSIGNNIGIAAAQNLGINLAMANDVKYILLSDQDTIYPERYVQAMQELFLPTESFDGNVAAVVPNFRDVNNKNKLQGFIVYLNHRLKRIFPVSGLHYIDQAIASGMILNSKFLPTIGLMNEKLFIDWVDLEWCWRARYFNFKIIGNADVVVSHILGDASVNFAGKHIPLRSPIRHYYIIRNCLYLCLRSKYLKWHLKLYLLIKAITYIIGFSIFGRPFLKNIKFVMIGIFDGVIGKLGKYK